MPTPLANDPTRVEYVNVSGAVGAEYPVEICSATGL